MDKVQSLENIKKNYPNEWVLLGNPLILHDKVSKGLLLFHHEDKKTVLLFAQNAIADYDMVKVLFTGEASKAVRLNVFKVTETAL
jgi:hypothetical protein